MTRAVLSLGSNLGDRYGHLRQAVADLGDAVLVVSGVYETAPWGDTDQPDYLNAVVLVADDVPADGWLARARAAERSAGRVRDPARPYGPRTLDVDVVAAWADDGAPLLRADPELTLPHPRAHQRAFVLRPWLDISPYAEVPGRGWVYDLVRLEPVATDLSTLRSRPDLDLNPPARTDADRTDADRTGANRTDADRAGADRTDADRTGAEPDDRSGPADAG